MKTESAFSPTKLARSNRSCPALFITSLVVRRSMLVAKMSATASLRIWSMPSTEVERASVAARSASRLNGSGYEEKSWRAVAIASRTSSSEITERWASSEKRWPSSWSSPWNQDAMYASFRGWSSSEATPPESSIETRFPVADLTKATTP